MGSQAHGPHSEDSKCIHTKETHTECIWPRAWYGVYEQTQRGLAEASHTDTNTSRGKRNVIPGQEIHAAFQIRCGLPKTIYSWLCRQNKQFLCILMFKISAFYNILYPSSSSLGNHSRAQDNDGCAIGMQFLSTNFLVLAFHCLVCLLSLCFRGASSHSSVPSVHP